MHSTGFCVPWPVSDFKYAVGLVLAIERNRELPWNLRWEVQSGMTI
jgi:hypothetical protein